MKYEIQVERYVQAPDGAARLHVTQSTEHIGCILVEARRPTDTDYFGYIKMDLDAELGLVLAEAMVLAAKEALELAKKGQSA